MSEKKFIKIGGLYKAYDKNNEEFLKGKIDNKTRMIFVRRNNKKTKNEQPDWTIVELVDVENTNEMKVNE